MNVRPVARVVRPERAATVAKAASGTAARAPLVPTAAAAPATTAAGVSWVAATAPRIEPRNATATMTTKQLASARPMPLVACSGPAAPKTRVPTETAIVKATAATTTAAPTSASSAAGLKRRARGRGWARASSLVTSGSAAAEDLAGVGGARREPGQERQAVERPAGQLGRRPGRVGRVGPGADRGLGLEVERREGGDHRRGERGAGQRQAALAVRADGHEVAGGQHRGGVRERRPGRDRRPVLRRLRADAHDAGQRGGEEREALTVV